MKPCSDLVHHLQINYMEQGLHRRAVLKCACGKVEAQATEDFMGMDIAVTIDPETEAFEREQVKLRYFGQLQEVGI